jgi:DNA-binding protein H-NS
MVSYQELLDQRAQLEADIAAARAAERRAAIVEIRRLMSEHHIVTHEILPRRAARRARAREGAVLYQDPASGATWSGRGRPPRWLAGKERELYRVKRESLSGGEGR